MKLHEQRACLFNQDQKSLRLRKIVGFTRESDGVFAVSRTEGAGGAQSHLRPPERSIGLVDEAYRGQQMPGRVVPICVGLKLTTSDLDEGL